MDKKIYKVLYVILIIILAVQINTYRDLCTEEAQILESIENDHSGWILGTLDVVQERMEAIIESHKALIRQSAGQGG